MVWDSRVYGKLNANIQLCVLIPTHWASIWPIAQQGIISELDEKLCSPFFKISKKKNSHITNMITSHVLDKKIVYLSTGILGIFQKMKWIKEEIFTHLLSSEDIYGGLKPWLYLNEAGFLPCRWMFWTFFSSNVMYYSVWF